MTKGMYKNTLIQQQGATIKQSESEKTVWHKKDTKENEMRKQLQKVLFIQQNQIWNDALSDREI